MTEERAVELGKEALKDNVALSFIGDFFNYGWPDEEYAKAGFAEDAEYYSGANGFTIRGGEAVYEKFDEIQMKRFEGIDAVPAVVLSSKGVTAARKHHAGSECLALKYHEHKEIAQLAFVEQDDCCRVKRIEIVPVTGYEYRLLPPEGWRGFTPRIVVEERVFDDDGNLREVNRRYLDGKPVEE